MSPGPAASTAGGVGTRTSARVTREARGGCGGGTRTARRTVALARIGGARRRVRSHPRRFGGAVGDITACEDSSSRPRWLDGGTQLTLCRGGRGGVEDDPDAPPEPDDGEDPPPPRPEELAWSP